MQWHPLFAELLRPLVESYFEVLTNVPVGDAPRSADLVLLRRLTSAVPPFQGLWRWLTPWNVLEFKGPTVSARVADLDLLIELGLGPNLWKEAKQMARRAKQGPVIDFRPVVEEIGLEELIRQIGLKRMIEEMGPQRVIEQVGLQRVVQEVGLKELVANLTPEQRQELRRLLK